MFIKIFYVLLLLPSLAFTFMVLATFYGARKAYLAISWIPITLFLLIHLFEQLLAFQQTASLWPQELLFAVRWTSLVQSLMGVALIAHVLHKGRGWLSLLLATCLTSLPLILRS